MTGILTMLSNEPLPRASLAGGIDQMRADIFEALYRHVEGYTGKELRDALHESNGIAGLVLADAVAEGELIAKEIEDSVPPDRRYRLSYSKWLEMTEA